MTTPTPVTTAPWLGLEALDWLVICAAVVALVVLVAELRRPHLPPDRFEGPLIDTEKLRDAVREQQLHDEGE